MSNARIQFSLASEDVWDAYNPQLKEGEIVTVLKANKKVKLVQGKVGGSTYSESTVIWDEDTAETTMSRAEAAAVTATAQANAASGSASKAAASQAAAATSATNAKASENAAKTSETNAKASESAAKNSATSAASSASTASTQAGKAADSATAAAGSATQAGTFATTATNQATAAAKSESSAKAYMDTTKDLSENVNVFVPSVDADGTLTWTNKAGLSNPAAVNIKGAKGDKGDKGEKGDTGTITVDAELSDTSTNPIQNKAIYKALLGKVGTDIFTGFALIGATATIAWQQGTQMSGTINATNYSGTARTALRDGESNVITETYAKKDTVNEWGAQQNFKQVLLGAERYLSTVVSGTSHTPQMSVMHYIAIGTFILNLQKIEASLEPSNSSVFTAYIESSADYPLHIETAGALKYIGSASDIAITSAGLLLNILMLKDSSGNVTSIVQASKLEGGA